MIFLDLSDNLLSDINDLTYLSNFKSLRKLVLSNNFIKEIPNIWVELSALEILNLHENKINTWLSLEYLT